MQLSELIEQCKRRNLHSLTFNIRRMLQMLQCMWHLLLTHFSLRIQSHDLLQIWQERQYLTKYFLSPLQFKEMTLKLAFKKLTKGNHNNDSFLVSNPTTKDGHTRVRIPLTGMCVLWANLSCIYSFCSNSFEAVDYAQQAAFLCKQTHPHQ